MRSPLHPTAARQLDGDVPPLSKEGVPAPRGTSTTRPGSRRAVGSRPRRTAIRGPTPTTPLLGATATAVSNARSIPPCVDSHSETWRPVTAISRPFAPRVAEGPPSCPSSSPSVADARGGLVWPGSCRNPGPRRGASDQPLYDVAGGRPVLAASSRPIRTCAPRAPPTGPERYTHHRSLRNPAVGDSLDRPIGPAGQSGEIGGGACHADPPSAAVKNHGDKGCDGCEYGHDGPAPGAARKQRNE